MEENISLRTSYWTQTTTQTMPFREMTLTLSNHMACRFLVTFNYGLFKKNYAIQREGIIRDAWDHKSKRILCATGYVNDPLDEDMENSQWDVRDRRPL